MFFRLIPYTNKVSPTFFTKSPFGRYHFTLTLSRTGSTVSTLSYDVVILGGGTGGLSVLANLSKKLDNKKIALVEPSALHFNQPLWTFVGAGLLPFSKTYRSLESLLPKNVDWIHDKAIHIDATNQWVRLKKQKDKVIHFQYLVLAPGLELRLDKVSGLEHALLHHEGISTNYHPQYVQRTELVMKSLMKGHAVFTMPSTPIKCAGAPQKIMYLADSHWRNKGQRSKIEISYFTGTSKLFSVPKYEKELLKQCKLRDLSIHVCKELIEVDGPNQIATFQLLPTSTSLPTSTLPSTLSVPYDFLHVTPPMSPPRFLSDSKLTDPSGYISVHPLTLQHAHYPNVFALGDATSVPTSRTAAAVASQSNVLVNNMLLHMQHQKLTSQYDGYTSCPLIISPQQVILAEFSGFDLKPMETSPFDQSIPSRWAYFLTSKILPFLYWNGLVTHGWWKGPATLRTFIQQVINTLKLKRNERDLKDDLKLVEKREKDHEKEEEKK
ncbi:hypothetical protein HMI54_008663 [Coelomomyces lativittatus]|nr:hypothetical protein HMI54_008663 [Coelomomyces lativittatus]KAJ1506562.1 hypothetical protein HMI55_001127 [Coelomomyces lativittatus]KAJ1511529.1 hypothetical protein HMI56_005275 [Coelomomyces lativittatus]